MTRLFTDRRGPQGRGSLEASLGEALDAYEIAPQYTGEQTKWAIILDHV